MLKTGRSWVRILIKPLDFFNFLNRSSRSMALGLIQPVREMSTSNIPGVKGRPVRKANLFAICEPIFCKIRDSRHLTIV
jgi:hypothetical protein